MAGRRTTVFLCGLPGGPRQERGDCPNELHDWPLAEDYNVSHDEAMYRLRHGWKQSRCPSCNLYGWRPGEIGEHDVRVPHGSEAP